MRLPRHGLCLPAFHRPEKAYATPARAIIIARVNVSVLRRRSGRRRRRFVGIASSSSSSYFPEGRLYGFSLSGSKSKFNALMVRSNVPLESRSIKVAG